MTYFKTQKSKISKFLLASVIGAAILGGASSAASAMVIQNCSEGGVGVRVTGQSSGRVINFRLEPGQKKSFQTSRGEKWRLNLNPIGKDVQYSGWAGNSVLSMVRIAGNLEVTRGLKCSPKVAPIIDKEIDYDKIRNRNHMRWCFRKYRSYNPETNEYLSFSGSYRECISPFI